MNFTVIMTSLRLFQLAIFIGLSTLASGQSTCASRRCQVRLTEGVATDIKYPESFEVVIDSLDEVRWTITAENNKNKILVVFRDITWPETELKFEELNPKRIMIRNEGKVFPNFPEYNAKLIKSGIFLSGTHSVAMEMDIPIAAELPSSPSFWMQFTAYSVTELYRCKLSSVTCDAVSSLPWKRTSDGYVYKSQNEQDEGTLTLRVPDAVAPQGRTFVSFGYHFEYKGMPGGGRGGGRGGGMAGTGARDEEARVTVECPGRQEYMISPDQTTQLTVDCNLESSTITFTARGNMKLVIADFVLHDAFVAVTDSRPGTNEPANTASVVPVVIGIFASAGAVVVVIIVIAYLRKKRLRELEEDPSKMMENKGADSSGLRSGRGRSMNDPDNGTYHYPSVPPTAPPPRPADTIYQEIEKKEPDEQKKQGGDKSPKPKKQPARLTYDELQLPGTNQVDSNKMMNGSPKKETVLGYESIDPEPQSEAKMSPNVSAGRKTDANGSSFKTSPKPPARAAYDYLEVLPALEHELPENFKPDGQPVLAHQDLYQHLERPDNPYRAPSPVAAQESKHSSDKKVVAEECYGKLDIANASPSNAEGANYITVDSNTDC